MTVPDARLERSFRAALQRSRHVQKTSKGAPAYSRYVNRRLGRYLAALAYTRNFSPNQVTLLSALCSYASIGAVALLRPSPGLAVMVTLGLVLGYALDSADGQLARLQGGGSPAGEWLDHMVDCFKICALHAAVLVCIYRFYPTSDRSWLLLPVAFGIVASTFFFGTILTDQIRRQRLGTGGQDAAPHDQSASALRSLIVLPTDYGLICLLFLTLAAPRWFLFLYGLLLAGTGIFLLAVCMKWYKEISRGPTRGPVGSPG